MEKVLEQSQITGTLEIEGEYIEYNMSELACLAVENPVAYVLETKLMISHILELLVGLPAEHFFGAYEGTTVQKTKYFKHQKKGIFGYTLSYCGTVEDHAKVKIIYIFMLVLVLIVCKYSQFYFYFDRVLFIFTSFSMVHYHLICYKS